MTWIVAAAGLSASIGLNRVMVVVGVDGVIEAHDRLKTFEVDAPVDVDAPSPGITRDVAVFAVLDPAIGKHWIRPRMGSIHEVDWVVLSLVFLRASCTPSRWAFWDAGLALPGTSLGFL